VARTADPNDRRSSLVAATPSARALMSELRTRKTAFLARRLEDLDPADRAVLEQAATILERMLDEGRSEAPPT
jgi:DNA-binding MarR family transcriptional regulator